MGNMRSPSTRTEVGTSEMILDYPKSNSRHLSAKERLIVALDCPTADESLELVENLGDHVDFYKVGWRLFLQRGFSFIEDLKKRGKHVFLDLKMDDIEETIENAVHELVGVARFITIHGNGATSRAAQAGRGNASEPKLLQVTLLSSLDQQDLKDLFGSKSMTLDEYVISRARKSIESGCDGVIASGHTIGPVRAALGPGPLIVSPGIRPSGSSCDDH